MGHLKEGKWIDSTIATNDESGSFVREGSQFKNWVDEGDPKFKPEQDRYHLYVSYACPWASRTLVARELKGLTQMISLSVVHPHMLENGWTFERDFEGASGDNLYHHKYLYEVYLHSNKDAQTKVTVPVLWDKKLQCIVNNESADILRIFNSSFNHLTGNELDLHPVNLQNEIEEINDRVYETVNNGVYKAGFATRQDSYEKACRELFETLEWLEERLGGRSYLVGERLTEADIRLFVTLIRFDLVYYSHFKCNLKRLQDYPRLHAYTQELYKIPEFRKTVFFDHIKEHYYFSQRNVNPHGVVPLGPLDLGLS